MDTLKWIYWYQYESCVAIWPICTFFRDWYSTICFLEYRNFQCRSATIRPEFIHKILWFLMPFIHLDAYCTSVEKCSFTRMFNNKKQEVVIRANSIVAQSFLWWVNFSSTLYIYFSIYSFRYVFFSYCLYREKWDFSSTFHSFFFVINTVTIFN